MPHLANKSQQITHQALFPTGVHSRVVNLFLQFSAGTGNSDFTLSPVLGNNITLLQVNLLMMPSVLTDIGGAFIHIKTGVGDNVSENDFINNWDEIIPSIGAGKPAFVFIGTQQLMTFNMRKLYMGDNRRFGVVVENLSDTVQMRFWVTFQFTEG